MHRVTFPNPTLITQQRMLPAGEYLVEDLHASWYLRDGVCTIEAPGVGNVPIDPDVDWNGKRILVGRSGGFGDLLYVTPIFREIRRRWPKVHLDAFCWPEYADAFKGNPDVDGILAYPFPVSLYEGYDARVWLENVVERAPTAQTEHIVDLFANSAGLSLEDKSAVFRLSKSEEQDALSRFPKKPGKLRVGIQVMSSTPVRTYPLKQTMEIVAALMRKKWEVFLFGSPKQVHSNAAVATDFVNLTQLPKPPNLRESAAILRTCDLFLGPDSGLVHLAGAMEIPTVALYGPFPATIRVAYAKSITALSGSMPCAPCFHHSSVLLFPAKGPCMTSRQCDDMASISPALILSTLETLAGKIAG